ncbi:aminotransferase class I/II-fold pyridoxal phosphate-dependent enzyme [Bacillus sp. BRMEA1]|uniref:aminotransferase class I/II-fold pyridoxal phosphate-dependent enzyme n=1 Tax=Neobacillus endophyticus TaxID=2738405 RepID=UPI00156540FF|nr:aminotransferase class I/II-fold pyridoxal phosphate-dependent enzyme [Neobacillus endophyticus]NRD77446.1 aminotransferase class I/II-fold pyridoxal phosphate-dependent enzyme [Neobacillus endophyticus]
MDQSRIPLYEALISHANQEPVSFHVPGHKYGHLSPFVESGPFSYILRIDATELSGLDDLHAPEGAILEAEGLLADLYKVKKSYFLVNGSTVGNLAMVMAACSEDDVVLVQRNCHKSILNALNLSKARPVFLEPDYNQDWQVASEVSFSTVKQAIQLYPEAKALILTYPNYYGMVFDLSKMIEEAHNHHIPVLVDEAHGAHFIVGSPFPASAVELGADVVVQSAHKTLPAMTMGSYLHFNSEILSLDKVKTYLSMLQSSSPSYPIMASLDISRSFIAGYEQKDATYLFAEIQGFKKELECIPALKVLEFEDHQGDVLKVTVQSQCGYSGFELQSEFERQAIYTEMADPNNILFILPLLKAGQHYPLEESVSKIKQALKGFPVHSVKRAREIEGPKISELAIAFKEMSCLEEKVLPIKMAGQHVCSETIIPYPPGIPLLLKGERITIEKLDQLQHLLASGARFQGGSLLKQGLIKVFSTT